MKYSLSRYAIELVFLQKLEDCKWYQFSKRREASKWRALKLAKFNHPT